MELEELTTIILIDDQNHDYRDGGDAAPIRIKRYRLLLKRLYDEMPNANNLSMILGDGIYKLNIKSDSIITEEFDFPKETDGTCVIKKIEKIRTNKGKTLVLLDYMLNNSENTVEQKKGKMLAGSIVKGIIKYDDIYLLLYTRLIKKNEERAGELKKLWGEDFMKELYGTKRFFGVERWISGSANNTADKFLKKIRKGVISDGV